MSGVKSGVLCRHSSVLLLCQAAGDFYFPAHYALAWCAEK